MKNLVSVAPFSFVVIPLGLDLKCVAGWRERRQILRDELGLKQNEVLVGIVGRLAEVKNHELFLEAAALCKERLANDASAGPSVL